MRLLLRTLVALLLLLGAAAGGLLWRLAQGPIDLSAAQPLLRAVIDRASPFSVSFTEPTLVWLREEGSIGLAARDLELRTPEGDFLGGAPAVSGVVAVAPLLEGRVEPEVLELELPELELTRESEGRLVLGFAGQLAALRLGEGREGAGFAALLGDGSAPSAPVAAALRRVRVTAPALIYTDATTGHQATATAARFQLERGEQGWTASLAARFGEGRMRMLLRPDATGGRSSVTVEVDRFPLEVLAALLPRLPLPELEVPVTGSVAFAFEAQSLAPGAATLSLATEGATIAGGKLGLAPFTLDSAVLEARLEPGWGAARIDRFALVARGFAAEGQGRLGWRGERVTGSFDLAARGLDAADILDLWPETLAPEARRWLAANLLAGRVERGALRLGEDGPQPQQSGFGGSFVFSGVELRYLPDFPTAAGVAGSARFAGESLALTVERGESAGVEATGGQVVLRNLRGAGPAQLEVELDLRSTVPAALALLDHEPIGLLRASGLPLAGAAGRQTSRLEVSLPLREGLGPDAVRYRARAEVTNLRLRDVQPGYDVAAARARLAVDPTGLDANGEVRVNGVPFALAWRENFPPLRGPRRQVTAEGALDAAAVRSLRFDWPEPLAGSVGVSVRVAEGQRPLRTVDLELDLGKAGLRLPRLLIEKPPGQAGKASARLVQDRPDKVRVERLKLDAGTLQADGELGLALAPLRPERVALATLRTPLGALSADLTLAGGIWRGQVDVAQLDLRPLRQGGRGAGPGADFELPGFAVGVSARALRLGDAPFTNLAGTVERRGGIWHAAKLRANVEDSEVTLDLDTRQGLSTLALRSNDAGWLIRAFGSSDNGVRGGQLRLAADLRQELGGVRGGGELKIRDFNLWGAPLVARIVSLASFSGLANALSGRGVPVSRLVIPFEVDGERLTLTQARLVAADIGARADGTIDLATGAIAVSGTVAPAYTINRILGRIPIIGQILSGTSSNAALAATFSVSGTTADPQITVNPLAALVPGLVRDLFAALTAADADSDAAPVERR